MNTYPKNAELKNYQSLMPKIPQKGPYWCIPASIENILKFVGIKDITQEDLVISYCRKIGNDSLGIIKNNKCYSRDLSSLNDKELINFANNALLLKASFKTMKDAVENSKKFKSKNFELSHKINIHDPNKYLNLLKAAISSQEPVLIATTNPDRNSHIRVVLAYDENNLVLYDPATDKIFTETTCNIKFNSDILILKRK